MSVTNSTIRITDPIPGGTLERRVEAEVSAAAVSRDGRWLAVGSRDGSVTLLLIASNAESPTEHLLRVHRRAVRNVLFSDDGEWLVTSTARGDAWRWNLRSEDVVRSGTRIRTGSAELVGLHTLNDKLLYASEGGVLWTRALSSLHGRPHKINGLKHLTALASCTTTHDDANAPARWVAAAGDRAGNIVVMTRRSEDHEWSDHVTLSGHLGATRDLMLLPGCRTLASAGEDLTVRVWDLSRREPGALHRVLPVSSAVTAMGASTNASALAVGGEDGSLLHWPLDRPFAVPIELPGHSGAIRSLMFTGDRIITGSDDGSSRSWSAPGSPRGTGSRILARRQHAIDGLSRDAAGSVFISYGRDRQPTIWRHAPSSRDGSRWESVRLSGHTDDVLAAAMDPVGRWVATAGLDRSIRLWPLRDEAAEKAAILLSDHKSAVTSVAFSPDGAWLASGCSDGVVRVWATAGLETGARPQRSTDHRAEVLDVKFAPTRPELWSLDLEGRVSSWSIDNPDNTPTPIHGFTVGESLVFSPDGRWLTVSSSPRLAVRDLTKHTTRVLEHQDGITHAAVFSADGSRLAVGWESGRITVFEPPTGEKRASELRGHAGPVNDLLFTVDGEVLYSASDDTTIQAWGIEEGNSKLHGVFRGHSNGVRRLQFTIDEESLVSLGLDGQIREWPLAPRRLLALANKQPEISAASFIPTERSFGVHSAL